MAGSLFRTKSIDRLLAEHEGGEITLKRTLGPMALVALGIGAIIGAGLFVRSLQDGSERQVTTFSVGTAAMWPHWQKSVK